MIRYDDHNSWCSNTTLGHWLFWYVPLFASFVWNAVAYTLIIRHYRNALGAAQQQMLKAKIRLRITLYLLVFFVCWIWDFINFLTNQFRDSPFWMELLTVTFMPLQGFLNFLVYGVSSRMFRHQSNKRKVRQGQSINYGGTERRGLLSSD